MSRRLPSLNALKAFEAAARHESFTDAAGELFVTHAAISRHVRDLEQWLGTELFTRPGRGVVLTDAGRHYAGRLTRLFDELAGATREIIEAGGRRRLGVSVERAIASRWLIGRLGGFTALHPDIELSIDPSDDLDDLHGTCEIGLRYGRGNWAGVDAAKLASVTIYPVCAPQLIAGRSELMPADLADFTLLHEDSRQYWADWLNAAGATAVDAWRGPTFQTHLAIDAAEAGQGFALGDQVLTADAIREGWLTRPFDFELEDTAGYYIVRAAGSRDSGPAEAFRHWLLAEMAETLRPPPRDGEPTRR